MEKKFKFKSYLLHSSILTLLSLFACAQGEVKSNPNSPEIGVSSENPKDTSIRTEGITLEFLMGKFDYRQHPWFQKAPASITSKEIYIQKEVLSSFSKMRDAAVKEGIQLMIISGTRNFNEQKAIWERKWEKESQVLKNPKDIALKILAYSSMPSTSRHHWGTDIDINSLEPSYFKSGKGLKEYTWLCANGPKYGFYQVYTSKKNGRTGYSEEHWHWSYLPLASQYLEQYNQLVKLEDIKGFKGSESAISIDVIKNYVNGIEKYK
jgi:D-alanyl-D-alanine carboxypeptidase